MLSQKIVKRVFILLIIIYSNIFICQSQSYDEIFKTFLSRSELRNAQIGLYIEDLKNNKLVYQYNENTSMIPASIFKIFSTSLALDLFGNDHKFKTELSYSGKIDSEGTLNGNLYLVGYGDPCFGSHNFPDYYEKDILQYLIEEVIKLGIKNISGNIISDISYFGAIDIPDRWTLKDVGNYYGSHGSTLNFKDNTYYVHFSTGSYEGSDTKITYTIPTDLGIDLQNFVKSSSNTSDEAYIHYGSHSSERIIKGTLPLNKRDFVIRGAIPDPAFYVAKALKNNLLKNNIKVTGQEVIISKYDNKMKKVITTVYSPELQKIIEYTNRHSSNLYAQVLSYHIAKKTGKTYSAAVIDFLKRNNISTDGLYVDDACGLSRFNLVTAKQMVQYLKFLKTKNYSDPDNFLNSLPIAGTNGTLRNLFVGDKIKVIAKSGSMFKIACYAGYIIDNQNNEFAFCFMVNGFSGSYYQVFKDYQELFKQFGK